MHFFGTAIFFSRKKGTKGWREPHEQREGGGNENEVERVSFDWVMGVFLFSLRLYRQLGLPAVPRRFFLSLSRFFFRSFRSSSSSWKGFEGRYEKGRRSGCRCRERKGSLWDVCKNGRSRCCQKGFFGALHVSQETKGGFNDGLGERKCKNGRGGESDKNE